MSDAIFFKEPLEQSKVKAQIVSKYFDAWSRVIVSTIKRGGDGKIAYIDLYAGPGRYDDGTPSTPLLVLDKAIANPEVSRRLVSIFRDKNRDYVRRLADEVNSLAGIHGLRYPPDIATGETGAEIVAVLRGMMLDPSLLFLDPCGYKGLSLDLVNSVIKDWACECIFFFNYNRFNAAIDNLSLASHVDAILSTERANRLRLTLKGKSPSEREQAILKELVEALTEVHGKYVRPFRFKTPGGARTSHYLIFVTKGFKGYHIMKNIMASASSTAPQGVPTFEYNPSALGQFQFQFDKPLDALRTALLRDFAGHTMRMREIYEKHSVGTDYVERNYKDVLLALEAEGIIKTESHKKGTFADHILVKFPNGETG